MPTHLLTHLCTYFLLLHPHLGQPCWCKGCDIMTCQVEHPWKLWDQECQEGFLGCKKEVGDEEVLGEVGTTPHIA